MSPRPKRLRRISSPPAISGFMPYGGKKAVAVDEAVFLEYEEYEAVRLCDYERFNHFEASAIMKVSRPTLTRIYAKARAKIAEALVTGRQLIIEGGKIYFDSEWFTCRACGCFFNNPDKEVHVTECPLCGSADISSVENFSYEDDDPTDRCPEVCICPVCGYEKPHGFGTPCRKEVCPQCNHHLIRKGSGNNKNNKHENSHYK